MFKFFDPGDYELVLVIFSLLNVELFIASRATPLFVS